MNNNELMHYGVLGMKWGIRRTPNQLARISNRERKRELRQVNKANAKAHRKGFDYDYLARDAGILRPNSVYAFNAKRGEAFLLDSKIASHPIKSIKADESIRQAIKLTNEYIEKYGDVEVWTLNYLASNNKERTQWKYR